MNCWITDMIISYFEVDKWVICSYRQDTAKVNIYKLTYIKRILCGNKTQIVFLIIPLPFNDKD